MSGKIITLMGLVAIAVIRNRKKSVNITIIEMTTAEEANIREVIMKNSMK